MTAREYLNELSKKRNEASDDNSAQGKKRYNQLSRRCSLAFMATREGVESVDLLHCLTENLIHDWALPDDKVKTFQEAVSVVWHDAGDDNDNEIMARHWSRRWSLVHTAINDGVKSVCQLQNLIENLTHQWMLPDDKVKTFREAASVEWHDAEAVKGASKQSEILTNRLSRRWSLVHTAVNHGVDSVEDLQHLLLHLTHIWKLSDGNVETFREAASVEWHDAQDQDDSTTQQLSQRWLHIHSKVIKGCSSVKKLQQELGLVTTDDMDGSYDDYIVDAISPTGMTKKSIIASKSSQRPSSEPGIQITTIISNSNLKTTEMNNQSKKSGSIAEQLEMLKKGPKFATEYMVYFDPDKAEGPYNDVYLFCFIQHGVITPNTIISEKGKTSTMRAGDCKELEDFFRLFKSEEKEDLSDDIQEVDEESGMHNMPNKLLKLYWDNDDLFDSGGADEALASIYELSIDADRLCTDSGTMFFSIDDLEGYLKEDLTDNQNAIVETMVKETYRFLLHTKWDADLPAELVDLSVDVAELFDDPYTHIDYRILGHTYQVMKAEHIDITDLAKDLGIKDPNKLKHSVDFYLKRLLKVLVDGIEPNNEQMKVLEKIAQIQYNLTNS